MEIWKDVPGYKGIYMVSNLGTVKSNDHLVLGKNNRLQKGRVLKLTKSYKGYMRVSLSNKGKKFTTGAHRLVALAFIEKIKGKNQVNHINGIKSDNRLENLEWCTNSENQIHAINKGLTSRKTGEENHNSKLSNKDVKKVRVLNSLGWTNKQLANDYGVSDAAMSKILRKKTYINI